MSDGTPGRRAARVRWVRRLPAISACAFALALLAAVPAVAAPVPLAPADGAVLTAGGWPGPADVAFRVAPVPNARRPVEVAIADTPTVGSDGSLDGGLLAGGLAIPFGDALQWTLSGFSYALSDDAPGLLPPGRYWWQAHVLVPCATRPLGCHAYGPVRSFTIALPTPGTKTSTPATPAPGTASPARPSTSTPAVGGSTTAKKPATKKPAAKKRSKRCRLVRRKGSKRKVRVCAKKRPAKKRRKPAPKRRS